jgi:AhpD family alkylhydroperoxidase
MQSRLEYDEVGSEAYKGMLAIHRASNNSTIEASLLELVKTRASQINGCAYCVDMHTKDARSKGETEQRLYGLTVWRETPYYTERERAALEWTEALTLIAENRVDDEIYQQARAQFTEQELVDLSVAIIAINGWNRLCVAFRSVPGTYEANHPVTQPMKAAV